MSRMNPVDGVKRPSPSTRRRLPGHVQEANGKPGSSDEKQAANAEMPDESRDLAANFAQVDFEAGEKKKRCDAKRSYDGEHPVVQNRP